MFALRKRSLEIRRQVVTDFSLQDTLLRRVVLYAVAGFVYFAVIQWLGSALTDPHRSRWEVVAVFIDEAIYWAPGLMVLLPLFAYDLLLVSNRVTGPIARLRFELRRLGRGEAGAAVEFRSDDFWSDMATEFNVLRDEVLRLREEVRAAAKAPAPAVRQGALVQTPAASKQEVA